MRFACKKGVLHGGRTQRFSECAKVVLRDFITVFDPQRRPQHVIEQNSAIRKNRIPSCDGGLIHITGAVTLNQSKTVPVEGLALFWG